MEEKLQEIEARIADANNLIRELHDKVDEVLEHLTGVAVVAPPAAARVVSDPVPVQSSGPSGTVVSEPAWMSNEQDSTLEKFLQGAP